MFDILEFNKFRDIKYYDENHSYIIDGRKGFGVSGFIGKFKQPFDSNFWAKKKADSLGVDKKLILDKWEATKHIGEDKGHVFHSFVENYLNNKIYPDSNLIGEHILKNVSILKDMFKKFYDDSKNILIPIKSELVVGDYESLLCGTIDQIFYNKVSDTLEIWDWKTNKKINKDNRFQSFKEPISHIEQSELNIYSLQLSAYKFIVEKTTKLKLGDCYIAWFNENNLKYKIFKCIDYTKEIQIMLNYMNNSSQGMYNDQ